MEQEHARLRVGVIAIFLFVHLYLSLRVAFSRFDWPDLPGNYATHAVLMAVFAFLHAWHYLGAGVAARFFATTAATSWCFEQAGVATGLVYGRYHYTSALGPKLGHVPIAIPIAWSMMLYVVWSVTQILLPARHDNPRLFVALSALVGGVIVTAWDAAIDPYFSVVGPELRWIWHDGGDYFGVPFANFLGWFVTGVTAYAAFGAVSGCAHFRDAGRAALAPTIAFALFTVATVCTTLPLPLRVTTACSMGLVSMIAATTLLLGRTGPGLSRR